MKPPDPKEIFENRASLKAFGEPQSPCDNCGLPLVFALETANGEQFSVDLRTVLMCLKTAEDEGYTPPITAEWWHTIRNHYSL